MFTGIIEEVGKVERIQREGANIHLIISADLTPELRIDQSISHNGVCLTVVDIKENTYTVTAIQETLDRTALGELREGSDINLERCIKADGRFDGHIVQGHVDTVARCERIRDAEGSWYFEFSHEKGPQAITVPKGSITVNGISLTVVDSNPEGFSVAVIPYTFDHTNFRSLKEGDPVNIEFDIVGKYISRILKDRDPEDPRV